MRIVKCAKTPKVPNPHGVSARKLGETPLVEVIMIALKPGEALKKHAVPGEAAFYVLSGRGIFEMGDEEAPVTADDFVMCPAHVPHRFRNVADGEFRVVVIKSAMAPGTS